jgi:integrase
MANYKPDLSCQSKFIPIDFSAQIIPGTFEHALAHIIDNHLDLSGEDHFQNAKSGNTRHLPLNTQAFNTLKQWQQETDGIGFVFKDKNNAPVKDFPSVWGALLDEAQITNFRFHDLRHHFASKLVMASVDLNTVRELLGHSDLKMTLRYAHLAPEHKAAAVNLIG